MTMKTSEINILSFFKYTFYLSRKQSHSDQKQSISWINK